MSNNHLTKAQTRALLSAVTVREATDADADALERLAQLDAGRRPAAPVLLAEVGGEVRAAVSMLDGQAVADPFHPTADLVAMLRMRSGHTPVPASSPIRSIGRSLWRRGERGPRRPIPSAPSTPGLPGVPTRAF